MTVLSTTEKKNPRNTTRVVSHKDTTLVVLQVTLGIFWLIDATLQFQPSMFGRAFVIQTLDPASLGTPWIVHQPAHLAAQLMIGHIAVLNACFASTQLLIALAIFSTRFRRIGLAVSIVWSLLIWWLAEGIGGVSTGATALSGAPGAAILYALAAVLLWPTGVAHDHAFRAHGATRWSPSRSRGGQVAWAVLWLSFAYFGLESANRTPLALHRLAMRAATDEPGWIAALNHALAGPLAHRGAQWSLALAAVYVAIAFSVFDSRTRRSGLVASVVIAAAIWLVEDFGGIFSGTATDVNTGPLLILLALILWTDRRICIKQ